MTKRHMIALFVGCLLAGCQTALSAEYRFFEYRVLAIKKTSTLQQEINAVGAEGFRLEEIIGGNTELGGSEGVAVMCKRRGGEKRSFEYKLVVAGKISTIKEMGEADHLGFGYKGQTVFEASFGGEEVVVIMERDPNGKGGRHLYRLVATSNRLGLEKELSEGGEAGFELVGMAAAKTRAGGKVLVAILRCPNFN
ncbi:MAG: hypothetical protein ACRD2L_11660 [Terriglobia bacterium]